MALANHERLGLVALVVLFCIFALLLFMTVKRPGGAVRGIENNVIVEQRSKIINEKR